MKKIIRNILCILLAFVLVVFGIILFCFRSEISTLSTLKQINSYPFYTMTYDGDYGFDDFLKQGAHSDRDIEKFGAAG